MVPENGSPLWNIPVLVPHEITKYLVSIAFCAVLDPILELISVGRDWYGKLKKLKLEKLKDRWKTWSLGQKK